MDRLSSPFPGMDPFLEEPSLWGSVHTRLMNSISDPLAELVSPDFYVDIQQHVTKAEAVITQVRNISTTGFELRMQEQERNAQVHAAETVDDIAREPSAGTLDGWTFEVNATQDVM